MNITIYISPEMAKVLRDATMVESDKVPDNNLILVDSDSTVDAVLDGKQQISSDKASVKFVAEETNYSLFMRNKKAKKMEEGDEDS